MFIHMQLIYLLKLDTQIMHNNNLIQYSKQVQIANKWDLGFHLPTNKPDQGKGRRIGWWLRRPIAADCQWPTVAVLGGIADKGRQNREVEGFRGHCG